jgi:hypothetical protein
MTISAVVKLIPSPPARVVSKNRNFSLSGLLYSSIARMRSSCAVLPSILQYSLQTLLHEWSETKGTERSHTELPEQTIVLQYVQHAAHLTENEHSRSFRFQDCEHFVKDDHFARVLDEVYVGSVRRAGFLAFECKQRCRPEREKYLLHRQRGKGDK